MDNDEDNDETMMRTRPQAESESLFRNCLVRYEYEYKV